MRDGRANVAHIVSGLSIGDGIQHVLNSICSSYNKDKYNLIICCLSLNNELTEHYQEQRIKVFELNAESSMSIKYFPTNLKAMFKLFNILKKEKVDIVTAHEFFSGTLGRIAAILARVPVVLWMVHSQDNSWKGKLHILIDKLLERFTDRIITNSESVKNITIKHENLNLDKFNVIYNGINLKNFRIGKQQSNFKYIFGINDKRPVITTIGHLIESKGHGYLLQAAPFILKKYPKTVFLMVGKEGDSRDGNTKKKIEKLIKELEISNNVILTGLRQDIPEILEMTDIFVLPAIIREGFGLVIIEAMAMGKPVVATKVGAIPEVVENGKTGILVSPADSEELAEAILELLGDKEKASYMGMMGRKRVEEKFNSQIMIKKLENLYDPLLRKKKRRIKEQNL